ncbi:site-specific integrase [Streptomyces sp. NBC_00435]|uniref:site-specific integrase n=1 Tax=Streptomyces sp. NBC_00435 TaxID=2903649 RepID=UPI002E1B8C79
MMTHSTTSAFAAAVYTSRLAQVDVCEAAGLSVRPGGVRPLVGQLVWDFSDVEGLPISVSPSLWIYDFARISDPRWRVVAQEFAFARLAPGHESVRELPHAFRTPLAITTCNDRLGELTEWLNWLTVRGVTSLAAVNQRRCDAYYLERSVVRDRQGIDLRPAGPGKRLVAAMAVQEPVFYSELFSVDGFAEGFIPWRGRSPFQVAGCDLKAANKVQPMRQEALQPWLAAALYVVEVLGPQVLDLVRSIRDEAEGESPGRRFGGLWREQLAAVIRSHIASGTPLESMGELKARVRVTKGWSEDDPLLNVNLNRLAGETGGMAIFHHKYLRELRPLLEEAVASVGLAPRWGRDTGLVARADGGGEVPWTEGIETVQDVIFLLERVRTACAVVLALLTGMRSSELMEMPVDACVPPQDLGSGRRRYRLRTKLIKGQELGGVWDEWVTVARAYGAAGLAADLLDPADAQDKLFGRIQFGARCETLRDWVNGPQGQRLGLARIPVDPMNIRVTRRTLAMELAHRPGGLLAAKIHLKHLSVVTTEGYAATPGGSQARFMADVAAEEQVRNTDLTLAAFRDFQQGVKPSGPGARDLVEFFTSVDEALRDLEVAAPGVRPGDQEVINLLARRAKTLHLGIANYCWFMDPSKALCLILAGTPGADRPLAGMCDSSRCPQATHMPGHRPVWASSAENKKVFIASIGRGQPTEKARLKADLDRDLRVLAEIDAACGTVA